MALRDFIGSIIPLVSSIVLMSVLVYFVLSKSGKFEGYNNSTLIKSILSFLAGIVSGLLITQAIIVNPLYQQVLNSI